MLDQKIVMFWLRVLLFFGTGFSFIAGFPDPSVNVVNDVQISQPQIDMFVKNIDVQQNGGKPVDARCELCKFMLQYLDHYLKENKTEATIDSLLHGICNQLPAQYKALCLPAIPTIEKNIEQGLPPLSTCIKAGFCQNKTNELLGPATESTSLDKSTPKSETGFVKVSLQSQINQGSLLKDQVVNVLNQNKVSGQVNTGLQSNVPYNSVIQSSNLQKENKNIQETNELLMSNIISSNSVPDSAGQLSQGQNIGQQQNYQQRTPAPQGEKSNQLPQNLLPLQNAQGSPHQGTSLSPGAQNYQLSQNSLQQRNDGQPAHQGTSLSPQAQNYQLSQNSLQQQSNLQQQTYQQGMPVSQGEQNKQLQQNNFEQQQTTEKHPTTIVKDEFSTPKLLSFSRPSYSTPAGQLGQIQTGTNQGNMLQKSQYEGQQSVGSTPKYGNGAQVGLMPGPVLLQPNQIGTNRNTLTSLPQNKYNTDKSTAAAWKAFHLTKASSYKTSKNTYPQTNSYKTSTTSSHDAIGVDKDDGFLDVNRAETEDDDWYHVEDDEISDGKDENVKGKDKADDDWNFWQEDDTKFKDNIDIDGGKTNNDDSNTDVDWNPPDNNEGWEFKNPFTDTSSTNKRPYIKELTVDLNKNREESFYEKLNMLSFYGWIIFFTFAIMSCLLFIRKRYRFGSTYHGNGSKSYSWKTGEEGKSLMKNVYT